MSYGGYAVDVTVAVGQRSTSLGGGTVSNRRLVMRWLRRQALRLADGHGCDVPFGTLRIPARNVDPVIFHNTDAPEQLRAWITDDKRQDDAIRALESGLPALLTVVDPAVELRVTLAGWPLRPARAVGDAFYPLPSTPVSPRRGRTPAPL